MDGPLTNEQAGSAATGHGGDAPVLIIGAGIGGLALALGLQRAGRRVVVYEQAETLTAVGAGLTLASNGTRVLMHLGLGPLLDARAVVPDCGAVRHFRSGATLVDIPRGSTQLERYGAPYCQIHRADLQEALAAAVVANDPGCLQTGHRMMDFAETGGEVTAFFENGASARGSLLVGCDGIRSTVRGHLFGDEAPRFTGYVAWRGLVPAERLGAEQLQPDSAVWIGPGRFLTRYRIAAGAVVNYVAIARTNAWAEESWSAPSTVDALMAAFREFEPNARAVLMATPPGELYKWGLFEREPLDTWTRGRVTLLGDAAHPITPFLGQGAVMALEDALVLARALSAWPDTDEALRRYEAARIARSGRVMLESRLTGEHLTTCDPDRYDAASHRNEETLELAAYDAVTVAL